MDEPRAETTRLSHVGPTGTAHMVEVTDKPVTVRVAEARGQVLMHSDTLRLVKENGSAKGDVLGVARIAGVLAAKKTSDLIPLCHGLSLTAIEVDFELADEPPRIEILGRVVTEGKTGVEMEALTAVTVAALTVYDMCKAVDREMVIGEVRLTYKAGGRSGTYRAR